MIVTSNNVENGSRTIVFLLFSVASYHPLAAADQSQLWQMLHIIIDTNAF